MVGTPDQWTGKDPAKPQVTADASEFIELLGRVIAFDRMMAGCRLQVLANRQYVHPRIHGILHDLDDLVPLFAQPHHDAGLCERNGPGIVGIAEEAKRHAVVRLESHLWIQSLYGLDVVGKNVRPGLENRL